MWIPENVHKNASEHNKIISPNGLNNFMKIALEIKAVRKWNRICVFLGKAKRKASPLWLLITLSQRAPLNNVCLTDGCMDLIIQIKNILVL